jgi:uncharacterized delta-60 repeat protein
MNTGRLCIRAALLMGVVCSVAFAERDTLWRRTLSGTGNGDDIVTAMACDSSGNILAAILGMEGTYGSFPTIRTAKYSPQGELLWTRRFAGPMGAVPAAIAVDNSDLVYVTGTCAQPGPTTDIVTSSYSRDGDSLWAHFFDAGGVNDSATALTMNPQGDVYVSGISQVGGVWSSTLLRYSRTGSLDWSRVRNVGDSLNERVYASVFDPAGYIYQVGRDDWRAFVQQYTASGEFRWEGFYRGWDGRFRACVVDSRGNLVAAGGTEEIPGIGLLTVKFDRSGSQLWAKGCIGGSAYANCAIAVQTDGQDNVYVGGNFEQSYLIVKYDTGGAQLWFRRGSTAMQDSLCALAFTPEGQAYASFVGDCPGSPSQLGVMVVKHAANGDSLWSSSWEPKVQGVNVERTSLIATPSGACIGSCYPWRSDEDDLASTVVQFRPDGSETWESEYNLTPGRTDDAANDVAFDREGNVIAVGRLEMTGESNDLAVVKYSPAGELLWWRSWNPGVPGSDDEALRVAVDSEGSIYALGTSQSDTAQHGDMVILKYDADGSFRWARRHPWTYAMGLTIDPSGDLVVLGTTLLDSANCDYLTVKYTQDGELLWSRLYSSLPEPSIDQARAVAVDATGSVYVTGGTRLADAVRPAAVVKYASDGSPCWVADSAPPGGGTYFGYGIHPEEDGSVWIAGFGHLGSYLLFMAKYGSDGQELCWQRCEDDSIDRCNGAAFLRSGRAVFSCYLYDQHGYAIVLDSAGSEAWRGAGDGCKTCRDVAVAADGTIFASFGTGLTWDRWSRQCAFDTLGIRRWSDSSDVDAFAIATNSYGLLSVAGRRSRNLILTLYSPHLGTEEGPRPDEAIESPVALKAVPNPFSQSVRLLARNLSPGSVVRVYDCLGRCIRSWFDRGTSVSPEWTWDGTDDEGSPLSAGVYVVRVEALGSHCTAVRGSVAARLIKLH